MEADRDCSSLPVPTDNGRMDSKEEPRIRAQGGKFSVFKASLICSMEFNVWGWAAAVVSMIESVCDGGPRVGSEFQGVECGSEGRLSKNEHRCTGRQRHRIPRM